MNKKTAITITVMILLVIMALFFPSESYLEALINGGGTL
jgi:hypothetical protein